MRLERAGFVKGSRINLVKYELSHPVDKKRYTVYTIVSGIRTSEKHIDEISK